MLSWFCRQSIAKKLAVGVGAQIVLLIAVCVISSLNSFSAEVSIDDLARRGDHKALVSRIEAEFSDARMFAWRTLATGETRSWGDAGKSLNAAAADLSQLVSITHTAAKREKAQALLPVFEKYRKGSMPCSATNRLPKSEAIPPPGSWRRTRVATVRPSPGCCPRSPGSTPRSPTKL